MSGWAHDEPGSGASCGSHVHLSSSACIVQFSCSMLASCFVHSDKQQPPLLGPRSDLPPLLHVSAQDAHALLQCTMRVVVMGESHEHQCRSALEHCNHHPQQVMLPAAVACVHHPQICPNCTKAWSSEGGNF